MILVCWAVALALWGCGGDGGASGQANGARAVVRYEIGTGAGFFDFPWPANARLKPDGTADLGTFPNPHGIASLEEMKAMVGRGPRWFSPSGAITFRFDRPVSGVVPAADPLDTVSDGATYFVVNLGDGAHHGERSPVLIQYTDAADTYRPGQFLQMLEVPGNLFDREETYAAVVLRSAFQNPAEVGQSEALRQVLAGRSPGGKAGDRLRGDFEPLRRYLGERGIPARDVIAATVFTTGDMTARLADFVGQVQAKPPVKAAKPLASLYENESYCALAGTYLVPAYQDGSPPYLLRGGEIQTKGGGGPGEPPGKLVQTRLDEVPYVITFPKGAMPASGFPLMVYVHGTGGKSDQAVARGPTLEAGKNWIYGLGPSWIAARRGYGTGSVAGPLNPERIGSLSADGYIAYNFFHPTAMRDNFAQMILDQVELVKYLSDLRVDPGLCNGVDASAAPDGKMGYDRGHLTVMGQSLGSYLTGMLAGLVDGIQGAILSGAGGGWGEFALGPKDPVDLTKVLQIYLRMGKGETLDRFHPIISIFDLAVGPADNLHYVRRIRRDPFPGRRIPHVLVIEGTVDIQVTANLQRALLPAIGLDLVGSSQTTSPNEALEDAVRIGGGSILESPVRGNRQRPDGSPLTLGALRYQEDGIVEGHYVVFQRDDAKHAYGCFLETLLTDAEGVATILRGSTLNGPCP